MVTHPVGKLVILMWFVSIQMTLQMLCNHLFEYVLTKKANLPSLAKVIVMFETGWNCCLSQWGICNGSIHGGIHSSTCFSRYVGCGSRSQHRWRLLDDVMCLIVSDGFNLW